MVVSTSETRQDYRKVSAVFHSYDQFTRAVDALNNLGLTQNDISVLMSETTRSMYLTEGVGAGFTAEESTKTPEGATIGGITGGLLGLIIGGVTMVGTLVAPGVGLVAAGPIIGALTGGLVGTAAGGLIGALVGMGIPEHEARFFEESVNKEGNIVMVVHVPEDRANAVRDVLRECNAEKVNVYS
jgi:hypothetical protein